VELEPTVDLGTDVVDRPAEAAETADGEILIEDELLVEEISIDGMCGVY
jgi:mycofactocin precursor